MKITRNGTRWTLLVLALAVVPHLLKMPVWLALAIMLIVIWRWLQKSEPYRPPPMLVRIIITLLGIGAVVIAHGGLLGRRAATTLLTVMLVLKLLELVRLRDGRLIVTTTFFLTATHFLFNQDLLYLPWMLACTLLGLAALRQLHDDSLGLDSLGAGGQTAAAGNAPPLTKQAPPLLKMAGRILFLALPVTLALFILFPRLATPLWGIPEYALDGKTGLSDSMRPGRIQQMFLDDSPAFRATFDSYIPPQSELYWRGPVLWHFDGTTWNQGNIQHADRSQIPPLRDAQWWYEIQLEPHEQHWMFTLDYPARWPRNQAFLTYDHQLVSRQPLTTLTRYEVATAPDFNSQPDELPFYIHQRALQLPPKHNTRTLEMMREWRERVDNDATLVLEALNYFREQEFYYSLEAPPLGADGVDEFLFDLRIGYCEYYASAFVVMMRAAGIPARVVTGYLGGSYNSVGDYLLVRQSDAHAWTEVWLQGQGWKRFDPTAMVSPDRVEHGASAAVDFDRGWQNWTWVQHIRTSTDAVRNLWNHWVLSFDSRRQERLLNPLGFGALKHQHLILLLVVLLGSAGFIIHLLLHRQRQRRSDPAQDLYHRALRRLRRLGLRKRPEEGALEFAHRVQPLLSSGGGEWQRISQEYYYARYADKQQYLASLKQLLHQFRPRLRAQAANGTAATKPPTANQR